MGAPYDLVKFVHENGKLPVVNFAAGGIATPADAALMMQLGCEGVFVGSGIFKSGDPAKRAKAIVLATTYYNDPVKLAQLSENLGEAMSGLEISKGSCGVSTRAIQSFVRSAAIVHKVYKVHKVTYFLDFMNFINLIFFCHEKDWNFRLSRGYH